MSDAGAHGPERIVIVGFGPVAARLIEHLEPLVAEGLAAVTVIGQEQDAAYNRVLVADVAVGRTHASAIGLADAAALAAQGIDVRLGTRVARVDRPFRRVLLHDGEAVEYDRLVLATGSRPVLPRLEGVDRDFLQPGVTFLRDLDDARRLTEAIAAEQRIVVLGGGILGIEAALAAAEEDARVTLVHTGRAPMERYLGDGARILGTALARTGITVIGGTAAGITTDEDGRFSGLTLEGGARVAGGALVIACGVRPRTELADGCNLNTAAGFLVDHDLRALDTSDVWAIGDCAEIRCQDVSCEGCAGITAPLGLIAPGWQQADQLGLALAAELTAARAAHTVDGTDDGTDDGSVHPSGDVVGPADVGPPDRRGPLMLLKARGVDAVTAGETDADPWSVEPGLAVAVWTDPGHGRYAKMITRDGVLTGLVCVGMPRTGAELVLLHERGSELPADRSSLLRLDSVEGAAAALQPGPDATLCRCAGITRGAVETAVRSGCANVREVSSGTRAGTGCGTCHGEIRALIEQHFAAATA